MWQKYLSLFTRSFIKSVAYRSEIFVWMVLDIIPTLVLLVVWTSIYTHHTVIKGVSIDQVLQYYLLVSIINAITGSHFEQWRVKEIRDGKIDYLLTKPLPYPQDIFIVHLGGKAFYSLITVPFYLFIWMVLIAQGQLESVVLTPVAVIGFFSLLCLGLIIEFFLGLIIVLLGFWFEGAEGLEHFKWISVTLFSGLMIPLALMPDWLRSVVNLLPFKYLYAIPIGLLQGTASLGWLDLGYGVAFVCGLAGVSYWLWQKAILKYTSAGG